MKITYLTNITNPQKTNTFIPVVTRATTIAASIGTLKITGASPGIASISAGQNIYIDPPKLQVSVLTSPEQSFLSQWKSQMVGLLVTGKKFPGPLIFDFMP